MYTGPGLVLCGSTWPGSPHSVPLRGEVGRCGGPGPLEKVAVEEKACHSFLPVHGAVSIVFPAPSPAPHSPPQSSPKTL